VPVESAENLIQLMFPCKCASFDYVLLSPERSEVGHIRKENLHQILFKNSKSASHAHDMVKISREVHTYTTPKLFMEILASERWRTTD
jgi:hypothetical protein